MSSQCSANRYCPNQVRKWVSFLQQNDNGNGELHQWPVCISHARPFFFQHLKTKVTFMDMEAVE